VEETNSMLGKT